MIPTIGRAALTQTAIDSVLCQQGITDFEIIVADCAVGSAVEEAVRSLNDQRVIYRKTPDGDPSLGWDFAFQQASGDYFIWLDDDNYLLPHALRTLDAVIAATGAEIVTGHHVYYYDSLYVRPDRRRTLGVTRFDGSATAIDPLVAMKSVVSFTTGAREQPYRFHPAATAFSRRLGERATARLGHVVLPRQWCNHSLQPILFGLAKSCVGISVPLSIVGRYGVSLTQTFNTGEKRRARPVRPIHFSPVHGDIYRNHVADAYFAVINALQPELAGITVSLPNFLDRYARELFFGDMPLAVMHPLWEELATVAAGLPETDRNQILPTVRRLRRAAAMVQPLKTFGWWSSLRALYRYLQKWSGRDRRRIPGATSETLVRLAPYGIADVRTLVSRVPELVRAITGQDLLAAADEAIRAARRLHLKPSAPVGV